MRHAWRDAPGTYDEKCPAIIMQCVQGLLSIWLLVMTPSSITSGKLMLSGLQTSIKECCSHTHTPLDTLGPHMYVRWDQILGPHDSQA